MVYNQDERNTLANTIQKAAWVYGRTDLSKSDIIALINVFEEFFNFSATDLQRGFHDYITDSKNKTFPSPAALRPYIEPELDVDTAAITAVNRIREAITKFGYDRGQEAKEFIGELGWSVVRVNGGWRLLCESHGVSLNPSTFIAQARDYAKATLKMDKLGMRDRPVQIGQQEKTQDMLLNDKKNEQVSNLVNYLKVVPTEGVK